MPVSLVIDNRQKQVEIEQKLIMLLEKAVITSLAYEGWDPDYEVSLSFVSNKEIQNLNRTYRGKDYATDVLSFPLVDDTDGFPMGEEKLLGDVVISVEKAVEQAKEYQHSFEREMGFLMVHSLFHLMGYDHLEETEAQEMRKREEIVLTEMGLVRE
ncbi:protein of unknown function UPF0054 [Alkaliphilus metalliredigens QYMF]|uniref:Endoribonuclease YbeY n=1 Tax=Alkaliphilus metalliredigens (strain QYMF) TaxID=293826 RepID=YBEY_ALKMQ|nr:rRNA maturation RNase YbeY [Alkaliphilus metalliredigens]A6TSK3.1 RecName: Full=Endoribonuclease YbeY [Alkaliphilus metalliredigens QYMF]ABR49171.1 protein of unknown function UPF0054 [Alkaliphilus metalliredigens QYMF]